MAAPRREGRAALTTAERAALAVVGVGLIGFAVHGYANGVPSMTSYLLTIVGVGAVVGLLRRDPLPAWLAGALAIDAIAHLSGGLIRVGDGVLYNAGIGERSARLGTHLIQGDHVVHTYGSAVAALAIWFLVLVPMVPPPRPAGALALLAGLGSMGIGALNELIEFVVTLLNENSHVGGYTNTGWDLVANLLGAIVGGGVVWRLERRGSGPEPAEAG